MYTGGKLLIRGTKHFKNNQLQRLKHFHLIQVLQMKISNTESDRNMFDLMNIRNESPVAKHIKRRAITKQEIHRFARPRS